MTNVANWVREDTVTTGTGAITLGTNPVTGFATFQAAFGSGTLDVYYSIESGNDRETGVGSFNGTTNVLTRTTVVSTLVSGVYDDTSPAAITLSGTSVVRNTFNAAAFGTADLTDATFPTHGKFAQIGTTAAADAGTTNIDFTASNKHELTGTATTSLGTWTFPGIGTWILLIPSTVTILTLDPTNKQEYGASAYTWPASNSHLVSITWDGTTAHWGANSSV